MIINKDYFYDIYSFLMLYNVLSNDILYEILNYDCIKSFNCICNSYDKIHQAVYIKNNTVFKFVCIYDFDQISNQKKIILNQNLITLQSMILLYKFTLCSIKGLIYFNNKIFVLYTQPFVKRLCLSYNKIYDMLINDFKYKLESMFNYKFNIIFCNADVGSKLISDIFSIYDLNINNISIKRNNIFLYDYDFKINIKLV